MSLLKDEECQQQVDQGFDELPTVGGGLLP